MTKRGWLAAIVVGTMAVLGLVGCSDESTQDSSTRDEEGNITEGGDVGVFALAEGDCFVDPPSGNLNEVEAVPCDEPHSSEVFALFDVDGDNDAPFPGDPEIQAQAEENCGGDLFEEYVGAPFQESTLGVTFITPTQQTWEQVDDREVICVAQSGDGSDLTESVAGSGGGGNS
jgi:hypothetical protein